MLGGCGLGRVCDHIHSLKHAPYPLEVISEGFQLEHICGRPTTCVCVCVCHASSGFIIF